MRCMSVDMRSQKFPMVNLLFNVSVIRRMHTLTQGPLGSVIILRLDCTHPLHHIACLCEFRGRKLLVTQSLTGNVETLHLNCLDSGSERRCLVVPSVTLEGTEMNSVVSGCSNDNPGSEDRLAASTS